jgi:hypothetical protein
MMFTDYWNHQTGVPIAGHRWFSEAEARERYRKSLVIAVDAANMGDDEVPRPRWLVAVGGRAKVRFLDEHRNTWRRVNYDLVDGRFFRQETSDYLYPTDDRHYGPDEALLRVDAQAEPDGTGAVTVVDRVAKQKSITEFEGIDVSSFWLDVPAFGEWDQLTDPGEAATDVASRWTPPSPR